MSRSTHGTLYQQDICMLRGDTDIQLVGTDTQNHAGKGNRCKLANRRKVTLCCWLWEVISKMLQQCTVESRNAQKGSRSAFFFFSAASMCARAHVCTSPSVFARVCLSLGSLRAEQTRSCLPNVNFEDSRTAGGGEKMRKQENARKAGKSLLWLQCFCLWNI